MTLADALSVFNTALLIWGASQLYAMNARMSVLEAQERRRSRLESEGGMS